MRSQDSGRYQKALARDCTCIQNGCIAHEILESWSPSMYYYTILFLERRLYMIHKWYPVWHFLRITRNRFSSRYSWWSWQSEAQKTPDPMHEDYKIKCANILGGVYVRMMVQLLWEKGSLSWSSSCTTWPSSVSKLHSSVRNCSEARIVSWVLKVVYQAKSRTKLMRSGLMLRNRIFPWPFVPFTQKEISIRPWSWFISPLIHGIFWAK